MSKYQRGREDERAAWEQALTNSHLPTLYQRLVRDLALAPVYDKGGALPSATVTEANTTGQDERVIRP